MGETRRWRLDDAAQTSVDHICVGFYTKKRENGDAFSRKNDEVWERM